MYKWICKQCGDDNPCICEMKHNNTPPVKCLVSYAAAVWEPYIPTWERKICGGSCVINGHSDGSIPNFCPYTNELVKWNKRSPFDDDTEEDY